MRQKACEGRDELLVPAPVKPKQRVDELLELVQSADATAAQRQCTCDTTRPRVAFSPR